MLTLRRFRIMADSYGADLLRWPDGVRAEAQALLQASPAARALLDDARTLDEAIAAAGDSEDAALWEPDGQDAALARLRSGVEARIAASTERRPTFRHSGWHNRWIGMATGGAFAIVAGLLIGAVYTTDPASDSVLLILQPAPIQVWAD